MNEPVLCITAASCCCCCCVTLEAQHGFSTRGQLLPPLRSCDAFRSLEKPEHTGKKENMQRDSCCTVNLSSHAGRRPNVHVPLYLKSSNVFICFQVKLCMEATFFTAFYINLENNTTKGGNTMLHNLKKHDRTYNKWVLSVGTYQLPVLFFKPHLRDLIPHAYLPVNEAKFLTSFHM